MEESYSKTVMLTCTGIVLLMFIVGGFSIFKSNQATLNNANAQSSARMQAEQNEAIGAIVTGSYIKALMAASPNSVGVEIWVDNTGTGVFDTGTKWDGSTAKIAVLVPSDVGEYVPIASTISGTTVIYKFNKKT